MLSETPCAKPTTAFPQGGGSSPLYLLTVRHAQKYLPPISIWLACRGQLHYGPRHARARTTGYRSCRSRLRVTVTLSLADLEPSEFHVSRVSPPSLCPRRAGVQQTAEAETHLCRPAGQRTGHQVCASQRRVLPRTC